LRLLLALSVAVASSGCHIWYKPVPVANAIGEETTLLAGDSVNVYRSDRFEVYGPSSEAVYDGYEQLNRAVRAFERHFGTRAPKLAFVLFRDSIRTLDAETARSIRDRGFTPVPYVRPRAARFRRNYRVMEYGGVSWPIAPAAAREMLRLYSEGRVGAASRGSDVLNRFPVWYRAAVIHLVGDAGTIANDLEFVRDARNHWQPLKTLLTLVVPASGDSLLDPVRRNDASDHLRVVAAQSSTFGRFLVEREGPAVIGRIGTGYLAGRSLAEMIGEFHTAPKTVEELETRWKAWVETREVDY
jgi:hypothetical protein